VRILVVNWQDRLNPEAGGAEIHLHEIFGRLVGNGHEVTLLVSGWDDSPAEETVDGMRVVRRGSRNTFPLHVLPGYRALTGGPDGFDVVVEDINKLPLFTPVWSRLPVVALVPHLFGTTAFRQASFPVAGTVWAAERLMPAAYRGVQFVVISDSTAVDLVARGFDARRIHVSYPGIDHASFSPGGEKAPEPTVAYVGRLRRYKGLDVVLHAMARLREQGVTPRFLIVGLGDDAARLRGLVGELDLGDQVQLVGYVSEERKIELLRSAWVNVYPSPKEGWGISNIEAAACGTPSVASDSPGLRESVRDGETGLLVPHDDVDAWARSLRQLLEDRSLRVHLGDRAVEHARRFTWEATADEIEGILRTSVTR